MQPSGFSMSDNNNTRQYILVINGRPEGPFSIAQLKEKNIKPGDFVKTPAMDDYKEAHEIAELREMLGFRLQPLPLQYFGSFDQRLLAAVLDWLIVSSVFIAAALIIVGIASLFVTADDKTTKMVVAGASVVILSLIPIANIIYHIVMESSAKQATYGKQLLKIRVTDLQGLRIDRAKAFTRNFFKIASTLTLFIGYLMSFFNKKQQCLHDYIAETLVIKDRLE